MCRRWAEDLLLSAAADCTSEGIMTYFPFPVPYCMSEMVCWPCCLCSVLCAAAVQQPRVQPAGGGPQRQAHRLGHLSQVSLLRMWHLCLFARTSTFDMSCSTVPLYRTGNRGLFPLCFHESLHRMYQCCGSMTSWGGSGYADPCLWLMDPDPGSGSCYSRHWPSRCQQKINLKKKFCLLLFEGT
jgi:hypothetical protein